MRALTPAKSRWPRASITRCAIRQLHDGNGTLLIENDDWRDGPQLEIEETTFVPTNELESAIVTTLPSGAYTAVIHERNGQSGVGPFEVYNLQNP